MSTNLYCLVPEAIDVAICHGTVLNASSMEEVSDGMYACVWFYTTSDGRYVNAIDVSLMMRLDDGNLIEVRSATIDDRMSMTAAIIEANLLFAAWKVYEKEE